MPIIKIIAKPGSKACKALINSTNITKFLRLSVADAVINYGLAGDRLNNAFRKFKHLKNTLIINRYIGASKLRVINEAKEAGILVPDSVITIPRGEKVSNWIEKRYHSIGGVGIKKASKRSSIPGKYYQRFINNRRFELRVHAFAWIDPKEWRVQKRLGNENTIAWNYKNGGTFQTVHRPQNYQVFRDAIEVAGKILSLRKMAFGAIDFVVTHSGKIYFLEINSAPGFTELSQPIYVNAFSALEKLTKKQLLTFTR